MGEEKAEKRILELSKETGNILCADCSKHGTEWVSLNLGLFLCTDCAGIHRKLGVSKSKIKSVRLDNWTKDNVEQVEALGNLKGKAKYERDVPLFYRVPTSDDPHVLKEQWIRAKYEREEFIDASKQEVYLCGRMEGYLWKRKKEDGRFHPRKFILSEGEDSLKYYIKDTKDPKAVIKVSDINATFVPEKIGHENGMQLSYVVSGSTRHIYVYSEDGKAIVDWYYAIKSVKLNLLHVAFPNAVETQLATRLFRDFTKEGWLKKSGPRSIDGVKKRWFTLDDRKIMYMSSPLGAHPKGEFLICHESDGFHVSTDPDEVFTGEEFSFTFKLTTPSRVFQLSAETEEERDDWLCVLRDVISRPITLQENTVAMSLVRKKGSNSIMSTSRLSSWMK